MHNSVFKIIKEVLLLFYSKLKGNKTYINNIDAVIIILV
jgi:hypothetical protein